MGYLTGDTPVGVCEISMRLPDDIYIRLAAVGALTDLLHEYNWSLFGSATPFEVSDAIEDYLPSLHITCFARLKDDSGDYPLDESADYLTEA